MKKKEDRKTHMRHTFIQHVNTYVSVLLKARLVGQTDCSVVRSDCCSCRGLRSGSQHAHQVVPTHLSLHLQGTQCPPLDTHMYIIENKMTSKRSLESDFLFLLLITAAGWSNYK